MPEGAGATPPKAETAPVPAAETPPEETTTAHTPASEAPSNPAAALPGETTNEQAPEPPRPEPPQTEPDANPVVAVTPGPEPETDDAATIPPMPEPEADAAAAVPSTIDAIEGTDDDVEPFPKLDIAAPKPNLEDEAPTPETSTDASELPPPPDGAKPESEQGRRLGSGVLVTAVAAAAVVITLGGSAIFLQEPITRMVPAAASIYARIGLKSDIPGLGLTIVEPKPRKLVEGDDEILEVVGAIRNDTKGPLDIPVMQARLLDGDGASLNVWLFRAEKKTIAAGESVEYRTEFRNPPLKAERLDITFTKQKNGPGRVPEVARTPAPDTKKAPDAPTSAEPDK